MPLTHTNRLKLSEMSVRPDQELTEYSLVDRDGNTYTQEDLTAVPETPDPARIEEVISEIESSGGKAQRVALADLANMAAVAPSECGSAVALLADLLNYGPPAVQGEALNVLTQIGESDPEHTRAGVESAVDLVDNSTHSLLRNEALQFLVMFVEHDSTAVTDAVPQLAALLRDESTDTDTAARILAAIGRSQPDALVDVVPKLELFLETEPGRAHVSILTAIGQLSKEHANITVEVIPTAAEFLSAEELTLRSNAAGVLADLADEYPTEVEPWVPDAIELMEDSDEQVRYNATSILARVADEHPDTVSPATEQLLAVLDERELANTRFNACWALKRVNATSALETVREVAATDPDDDVRSVARLAADSIED
ncbi:HEAT repeat-containing protein [Halorubrum xinjiangense]|uniref:HEAT repeat-containing protein n=2 Tax=Halorubrum xinjiangense TaxID=261291 RepID=A0A1G7L9N6_9EURY|nr:HEAT repeat-containing protein [Halorubrum xinjiangense]